MTELLPYLRLLLERRRRLLAGIALMLATVLAGVGLLSLSGWLITATAVTAALWAAGHRVAFDLYVPGGTIRFFALARTVSRYFERIHTHDTTLQLLADLRSNVFAALARLDTPTLARLRSGALLNRLTADIDALDNLYLRLLAPPVTALLASLAVTALAAWLVPGTWAPILATLLVLLGVTTLICARHGLRDSERQVTLVENLRLRLLEQFQGLAELIVYGALPRHRQWFTTEEDALIACQRRLERAQAGYNALVTAVMQLLGLGVLGLALLAFQAGTTSAALAVFMPLAVLALGEAFTALPAGCLRFGATRAAARRLSDTVRRSPAPAAEESQAVPRSAELRLTGLRFRYPAADQPVLDDVDLVLAEGERLAVTGPSGAGKSTFAELLAGLRPPAAGRVSLGGIALDRLAERVRREWIACLTQRSELFEASLADNLRIAAPEATEAGLWRALHTVALAEWAQQLPEGLQTWIGESGRRISGGQGRRLALARLLLRAPRLVVLDEPFAGLDRVTVQTVGQRLQPWLHARTCVVLCHDADLLPGDWRVLRLYEGKLIDSDA